MSYRKIILVSVLCGGIVTLIYALMLHKFIADMWIGRVFADIELLGGIAASQNPHNPSEAGGDFLLFIVLSLVFFIALTGYRAIRHKLLRA
jgi:xanthine/uracil permease